MTTTITFTIHGEPMSKARARVVNGHAFTPQRTRVAEAGVLAAFMQVSQGWNPAANVAFEVQADFYAGTRQRRDLDNMVKLVLDALNRHAWTDDVLVVGIAARKLFVPKTEARTVVTIRQLPADLSHTKPCAHCGSPIKFYASSTPKWCSTECRNAARHHQRLRVCKGCHAEFIPKFSRAIYCSAACKHTHQTVEVPCTECGVTFTRPLSWVTNGRPFCSPVCRAAFHRRTRAKHARGQCVDCSGTTSKRIYVRCQSCAILHKASSRAAT